MYLRSATCSYNWVKQHLALCKKRIFCPRIQPTRTCVSRNWLPEDCIFGWWAVHIRSTFITGAFFLRPEVLPGPRPAISASARPGNLSEMLTLWIRLQRRVVSQAFQVKVKLTPTEDWEPVFELLPWQKSVWLLGYQNNHWASSAICSVHFCWWFEYAVVLYP